jgi:hypothetical protein
MDPDDLSGWAWPPGEAEPVRCFATAEEALAFLARQPPAPEAARSAVRPRRLPQGPGSPSACPERPLRHRGELLPARGIGRG